MLSSALGRHVSQAHRNAARQIPRAAMMFVQNRADRRRRGRTRRRAPLPVRCSRAPARRRRTAAAARRARPAAGRGAPRSPRASDLARRRQAQATQAPRRLARFTHRASQRGGRKIHRAVAGHFLAVDGAHRDFVRPGAPDVGHFAARGMAMNPRYGVRSTYSRMIGYACRRSSDCPSDRKLRSSIFSVSP